MWLVSNYGIAKLWKFIKSMVLRTYQKTITLSRESAELQKWYLLHLFQYKLHFMYQNIAQTIRCDL